MELEAMTRYTSPVNPAVFPHLTVVLLAIGMFFTAWFFVYEVTSTKYTRDVYKELLISLVASLFMGFGVLFLLLWVGIYVWRWLSWKDITHSNGTKDIGHKTSFWILIWWHWQCFLNHMDSGFHFTSKGDLYNYGFIIYALSVNILLYFFIIQGITKIFTPLELFHMLSQF